MTVRILRASEAHVGRNLGGLQQIFMSLAFQ